MFVQVVVVVVVPPVEVGVGLVLGFCSVGHVCGSTMVRFCLGGGGVCLQGRMVCCSGGICLGGNGGRLCAASRCVVLVVAVGLVVFALVLFVAFAVVVVVCCLFLVLDWRPPQYGSHVVGS